MNGEAFTTRPKHIVEMTIELGLSNRLSFPQTIQQTIFSSDGFVGWVVVLILSIKNYQKQIILCRVMFQRFGKCRLNSYVNTLGDLLYSNKSTGFIFISEPQLLLEKYLT